MHRLQLDRFARWGLVLSAVLVCLLLPARTGRCEAGDQGASGTAETAWLPLDQALQASRQTGKILVVVTSSGADPGSSGFVATLKEVVAVAATELAPIFTEMPLERYESELKRIGVTAHPTLILYRAGPQNIELVGSRSGFGNVRQAFAWLDTVGVLRTKDAPAIELVPPLPDRPAPAPDRPFSSQADSSQDRARPARPRPRTGADRGPSAAPVGSHALGPGPVSHRAGRASFDATPSAAEGSAVYASVLRASASAVLSSGPDRDPRDGNGVDTGRGFSSPGSRGHPAPGTDDRGGPDAPTQHHLRRRTSVRSDDLLHASGRCPRRERSPADLHGQCAPADRQCSAAPAATRGDGPPTATAAGGDGAPAAAPAMAMAPQPQPVGNAPQQGQSPMLAAVLTNPSLVNRLIGALGEHLAQRRNPRIQMGQAPQMMQAPMGNAPVGNATWRDRLRAHGLRRRSPR